MVSSGDAGTAAAAVLSCSLARIAHPVKQVLSAAAEDELPVVPRSNGLLVDTKNGSRLDGTKSTGASPLSGVGVEVAESWVLCAGLKW